jgi:hypothetical protein
MAMITRNQIQAHREAENYLFAAGTTAITTYALASGFGKVGPLLQNSRAQDLCKTIASVASSVSFKAAGMAAILGMFCVTDRFSSHPPLPDQIEQMAIVGAVSDGQKGFWFGSEVGIMMGLGSGIGSVTEIITGTAGADKKIALGMLGLGTGSLGIAMGLANLKIRMMVASEAAQNALRGRTRHLAGSVVESFGKGAVAGGTVALAGHLLVLPLVARFNGGATVRVTEALSALSLAAGILA